MNPGELQAYLSTVIERVKRVFKVPTRVAIVIRTPTLEMGNVLIGDATPEDIADVLRDVAGMEFYPGNDQ